MENDARVAKCYEEGKKAWMEGKSMEECPYPHRRGFNSPRYAWLSGWLDAKYARLLGGKDNEKSDG